MANVGMSHEDEGTSWLGDRTLEQFSEDMGQLIRSARSDRWIRDGDGLIVVAGNRVEGSLGAAVERYS
jgi:hypothetical protein